MKAKTCFVVTSFLFCGISLAQTFGNAILVEKVDPFTDENSSRVLIASNEADFLERNRYLVWRCAADEADKYEFYISGEDFLNSSGNSIPVRYRFGDEAASEWQDWAASTDGDTPFANQRQRAVFTQNALKTNSVLVGLQDYNGSIQSFTFDLAGINQALQALACVDIQEAINAPPISVRLTSFAGDISRAYEVVMQNLDGVAYTEELNVIHTKGVTIRFQDTNVEGYVFLEGTDEQLISRLERALDQIAYFNLDD